ncbi:hypothetical protein PILCRDRAFT_89795 [Piloderma croceum F 1598]|uniref:Uncharacterized protein n=1 Tax=Piloderma croceum (strain F 1598) TaxID=765440 RepID=A0A0C3F6H6_PILCF|nr:hypothetical protein PILCRDRAFT_89795 [Piloderma croceum F 1598]
MTTVTAVQLLVYAERVQNSENTILQYSRDLDRLHKWEWPSSTSAHIHPSELHNHHMSHRMLGPCCLCPPAYPNGPDFVEAAMYMVPKGSLSGQYVTSCAQGKLMMERLYNNTGLPIKCYPQREFGENIPPQVTSALEELQGMISTASPSRPLKRTYAMLNITSEVVPNIGMPTHHSKTTSELLGKLDAHK